MVSQSRQLVGAGWVVLQERVTEAERPQGERQSGTKPAAAEGRHLHAAPAEVDDRAVLDGQRGHRPDEGEPGLVLPAEHGDGRAGATLGLGHEAVPVGGVADRSRGHHGDRPGTVAAGDAGERLQSLDCALQGSAAEPPGRVDVAHQPQCDARVGEHVEVTLVGGSHHQQPRRVRADIGDGARGGAHIERSIGSGTCGDRDG